MGELPEIGVGAEVAAAIMARQRSRPTNAPPLPPEIRDQLPPPTPGKPRSITCLLSGDVDSADYTASTLPTFNQAGQRVVEFQSPTGIMLLIPCGAYSNVRWSRHGGVVGQGQAAFAPLVPGVPIVWGRGAEVFLRQDANGGLGTLSLQAVPVTDEDLQSDHVMQAITLAVAGRTGGNGSGTVITQLPNAATLGDADGNPITTRVGADLQLWEPLGALWHRATCTVADNDSLAPTTTAALVAAAEGRVYDPASTNWMRLRAYGYAADGVAPPTIGGASGVLGGSAGFGMIFNDRTTNSDRLRQPDSYSIGSGIGSNLALGSTGVILGPTTVANPGFIDCAFIVGQKSGNWAGAVVVLEIIRAATTYLMGATNGGNVLASASNQAYSMLTAQNSTTERKQINLLANDQWQVRVAVASTVAATADVLVGFRRERNTF